MDFGGQYEDASTSVHTSLLLMNGTFLVTMVNKDKPSNLSKRDPSITVIIIIIRMGAFYKYILQQQNGKIVIPI